MNAAEVAAQYGLQKVGARPGLWTYLKQTWARRDFAYTLAKSKIQARNQANRLGIVWEILKPTLNALMYGAVFGILQGGNRPSNYPAYVVIGVFLFEFFSEAMSHGARSITGNRSLVQSLNFPRMTLPFSTVIQQLLTLAPMLVVMGIYVLILGGKPQWGWLLMIPLVALFTLFNMGIALIFARLTVHLADLTQLIPLLTRVMMYTSGVLFSVEKIFAAHPWVVEVYNFHPIYQTLEIARGIMLDHHYDQMHWLYLSIWSVVILIAGTVFFWQAEERYGREH
ncbi:ABC transporter permease [Galactobacter valiniphilus]|uniref:ABC transporter permease n=1 Tax=Galactobacter valiniphilus TaxID=2676122 RepID=UPI003735B3A9